MLARGDAESVSASSHSSRGSRFGGLELGDDGVTTFRDDQDEGDQEGRLQGRCGMFSNLCSVQRWKYPTIVEAKVLSWLSIAVTIITSSVGIAFAVKGHSALMLAYGLEAAVDILSSVVILWRFKGTIKDNEQSRQREGRAQALIGISLLVTGVIVFIDSCVHLSEKSTVDDGAGILVISIFSFLALSILGILQAHVGIVLKSNAVFEDAVAATGSALLSLSAVITIAVNWDHPTLWWFDSVTAIIVSLGFLIYGVYILRQWSWYRCSFWFPPEGAARVGGRGDSIDSLDIDENGNDLKPLDIDMV
mmetsp:Transcript_21728/g.42701  ORF Transcript_21728/g.42701 Transcript_21728/m.42701 type:complete len:306 (+) Transcript_21728:101-1018(+)